MKRFSLILVCLFFFSSIFCGGGGGGESANPGPQQGPPDAPAMPTVTPAAQELIVAWAPVANATSYEVWYYIYNNPFSATCFTGDANDVDTTCTITGLGNGTNYYVWIRAKNSYGISNFSPSGQGTTSILPAAPGAPMLTPSNLQLTASWNAVTGATGYEVWYNTTNDTGSANKFTGDSDESDTICIINSLINGTPYYVWVKARNSYGTGDFSNYAYGTPPGIHAQWARTVSAGPSYSYFHSVSAGSDGIYAVGEINGGPSAYNFGNGRSVTINNSHYNIVLVKYNTDGLAQWCKTVISGPNTSNFYSVSVGSNGIYAVGRVYSSASAFDFGNLNTLTINNNAYNILMVKYDSDGNTQWIKTVSSAPNNSYFCSVSSGSDGIYAAGGIFGHYNSYNFGNGKTITIDSPSYYGNMMLIKYDFEGNTQWVTTGIGPDQSSFYSVAAGNDAIYAAGFVEGTGFYTEWDFSNNKKIFINNNYYNLVLVKYDTLGNAQWAQTVSSPPNNSVFNSVAIGSDGVYAAGYIGAGTISYPYRFGGVTLTIQNNNNKNLLLVKYNTEGTAQWAKSVTAGIGNTSFNSVSVRSDGIYAVGSIMGNSQPYNFGNGVVVTVNNSNGNILLVKYDFDGNAQWVKTVEAAPDSSYFNSVSVTTDSIYGAGCLMGNSLQYNFGNGQIAGINNSINNILLIKYK